MNVNRQIIIRWLKNLFYSGSVQQADLKKTGNPPPLYEIGDAVQVVATAVNSARCGIIRERIWHYEKSEWMYFINDEGLKVSKRYFESDLEIDHRHLPVRQHAEIISKKLTVSGSLVEAHELLLEMKFTEGEFKRIVNPLGTEFDLADIFLVHSNERLGCSRFLQFWSNEEFEKFSSKKGIWLSANSEDLFLEFAAGEKYAAFDAASALFFPILDELQGMTKSIRLVVTCSN